MNHPAEQEAPAPEVSASTGAAPTPCDGEPSRCENCLEPLTDAYCAACGQPRRSPVVSVRAFAAQVLNEVGHLDSRLIRTLRALIFRPGHLTREYLDGRRVRYTQPVQLYLFAAAVFFLLAAYRPFVWIDTARLQVVGTLAGGITVGNQIIRGRLLALGGDPTAVALFAERFVGAATGALPVFLVGSVIIFSLIVLAVNRGRERRYIPHAVFTLHWTAFYLLLTAVTHLFPHGWLQTVALIPAFAYLTLALRRTYGQGVLMSIGKATVLFLAFLLILSLWLHSAILIGLRAV